METAKLYDLYRTYPQVATDTRGELDNKIFFCLKGPNFNANTFAKEALSKGAAYVVSDEPGNAGNEKIIIVTDVLQALQQLARFHRSQFAKPVIGLTGSNGKTTNKELMAAVLATTYTTHATKGNLNNHIGVPLSLLSLHPDAEIAVIEMGANHQGEIRDLSNICLPDYGLITNIGLAHVEGFGGPEGVKKGKKELFDHIRTHGGKVFVNADDPVLMEISAGLDRILFGRSQGNYVQGTLIRNQPFVSVSYSIGGFTSPPIQTQLVGDYNFANIMAAICVGCYFGVSHPNITRALETYAPTNQRSQLVKTARNTLVLDAYNANPNSMEAAVRNFAAMPGPKLALLGHMLELGEDATHYHQELIDLLVDLGLEAMLAGEHFAACDLKGYRWFENSDLLAAHLATQNISGYSILLKGSRMAAMEKLEKVL
jgi:UDP-N-acetylmuramoyl-tripeptide--D-alanyl-D-alanine ligase